MTDSSTNGYRRALAAGFYLGLLPLYLFLPGQRSQSYSRHHFRQAGALFAVFIALSLILAATALGLSYLLIYHRALYEGFQLERYLVGTLRKLYLAWLVFWAFGLCLALVGSTRPMPLIHRIADRAFVWRSACIGLLFAYGIVALLVPVAYHGAKLAPAERIDGPIQFLYEDNNVFPRWFFLLAFYPMSVTATSLWGEESVVVQRLDRAAVIRSVEQAEVIYLGSHGTEKGLMLKNGWLVPSDLEGVEISPNLRFVYLTGCDSGQQRDGWLAAFSPAEVVTYDRLSAVLEHAWWLWFRGPEKLRAIHQEQLP